MKGIHTMKDMNRIIERTVHTVWNEIGIELEKREFHICNKVIEVRGNKLYLDTAKIAVDPKKLEEVINKVKEELTKKFEIVEEETLYSFRVITLKLK